MKLTLQTQLLPDNAQAVQMRATLERFNQAATWLAGKAFEQQTANKIDLHHLHYRELRKRFDLSSQMAVRCIAQVCEAYKRDKTIKPEFRKYAAMPFDQRMMSFKGVDRVSLLTLQGRVIVPFVMGAYQRERFMLSKGQADLVLRKDGKWFLLITVDMPESAPIQTTDFLGVDLGTVQLATDSDGQHFDGAETEASRLHYLKKKRQLQRKAAQQVKAGHRPKNVRRKLKALSGRERRFKRNTNHVISRRIVDKATGTNRGIALEDLSGIRDWTRLRRSQRDCISKWAFAELRGFIQYKATIKGIPVIAVDPAYTSQACNACGHTERGNRRERGIFWCTACGYFDHADINAAKNISMKAVVNQPDVAESKTHLVLQVQRQAASL